MPSRWEVRLAGPEDVAIPLAAPQAVVSSWLDDQPDGGSPGGNPVLSPHRAPARAWSFGPVWALTPGETGRAGTMLALQVRLLDDALGERLRHAVKPGTLVDFGSHKFRIVKRARKLGQVSWPELRRWKGQRAWQVRFVTPVCMRRGIRTSPWPAPESITRSLCDRWQQLEPGTVPTVNYRDRGQVWVSDIEGHNQVDTLTRRVMRNGRWVLVNETISGFVGRIRYVCDQGDDATAASFHALMGFALFAGAGSHTTYGFGAVCADRTWQPPTVQAVPS